MYTKPMLKRAAVWIPACLIPCLTACAPQVAVQPTKPVRVVEYKTKPISADLLREAEPASLPPHATWGDVWKAYLQERDNNVRLNCQLEAIGDHLSDSCRSLLGLQLTPPQSRPQQPPESE